MVFDTDCVLCSGMVGFLLANERDEALRFVGAWSDAGLALAAAHGFGRADLHETFLVIRGGEVFVRSDAGLKALEHMKAPWRWLRVLKVLPRPVRDGVYRFVARRRYRWFGRRENCAVVPADRRHRFIGVFAGPTSAQGPRAAAARTSPPA